MLLIVGLGNPGAEYAAHRHNVGFMAVDAIHRRHGFGTWRRRFNAAVAEGTLAGEKVLLVKPQTYMNESGRAVGDAAHFYKIEPKDIVAIHDEVDLAPGKVRMKAGGGSAGHNGLRSLSAALGDDYRRLRIGVGHPASRRWCRTTSSTISPRRTAPGSIRFSTRSPSMRRCLPRAMTRPSPTACMRRWHRRRRRSRRPRQADATTEKAPAMTAEAGAGTARSTDPPARSEGPLARGLKRLFGSRD